MVYKLKREIEKEHKEFERKQTERLNDFIAHARPPHQLIEDAISGIDPNKELKQTVEELQKTTKQFMDKVRKDYERFTP